MAIEGAKSIIDELKNEYDFIILPVGTGTTLEGIIKGIKERKLKTKIIAFSALKENKDDYERINPIENSIWWIEYAGLQGIRMDTYPYPDKRSMSMWAQRILNEYPNFRNHLNKVYAIK